MVYIMTGNLAANDSIEILRELETANHRAAAIVGGTLVEIALQQALTIFLHSNKKITDELFRSTGAFGAFSTKIHLGMLAAIIHDGHRI